MKNWQPEQDGGGALERGANGRKMFTEQVDVFLLHFEYLQQETQVLSFHSIRGVTVKLKLGVQKVIFL